mmetsp:Transcript_13968/g.35954  ORF Transcript_13968/g.35954 Transcript_13968/m.35954 type:complete len:140 (+) Transcript_13968:50-469(+)
MGILYNVFMFESFLAAFNGVVFLFLTDIALAKYFPGTIDSMSDSEKFRLGVALKTLGVRFLHASGLFCNAAPVATKRLRKVAIFNNVLSCGFIGWLLLGAAAQVGIDLNALKFWFGVHTLCALVAFIAPPEMEEKKKAE